MSSIDNPSSSTTHGFGRGAVFSVVAVVIATAILISQRWGQSDADQFQRTSVSISGSSSQPVSSRNPNAPSALSAASAKLPPGCITAGFTQATFDHAEHPLDPLLKISELAIAEVEKNVTGYTATMLSRVFADGKLQDEKQMFCKIRHQRKTSADAEQNIPFSVYTRFLHPKALVGQEVIFVEGQNDGKLIAHLGGLLNLKRGYLEPAGARAMEGNRYPITDIGIKNLIVKMKQFGQRDRKYGECSVKLTRGVHFNERTCTLIEVVHPHRRPHFDFHMARVFIDDQWNFPIGYEGYLWPESEDKTTENKGPIDVETLPLLEKYYYTDLKLNPELTDQDFDPSNPEYNYPVW